MAEVLGRNLHISRKPVAAPGAAACAATTDLEGRRGVRIMPEIFDVTDDPTQPLFGHEEVDDEGVPDKSLSLVEKGVLKDFLRTRQPVRGYNDSNGHARLTANYGAETPVPTNLLIRARETSSIADLKMKLIDLIQQRGLPYGMIVRKMDFPSSASIDEARRILSAGSAGGSSRPVSMPLYAWRLYPDGHEELVRGVRFKGVNARSLKDILAAGDDSVTFNYLDNGAPFALLGFGSGSAEVTVVAPSVLIDDLEMAKIDDEMPKLPIVPAPSKILSRYVFREILSSSFLAIALATFVIFLQGIGKELSKLLVVSSKGSAVLELLALSMPPILLLSIPFGVLVGILVGLGRLSSDNEMIAMRSGGVSSRIVVALGF